MGYKIFLDTNLLIDFIEQRPFDKEALIHLFELAEKSEIDIFISESVIATALYITSNVAQIERVLKITDVICIRASEIKLALSSSFGDKEDAILYYGAIHSRMDYFITRNENDFAKHTLKQLPVLGVKAISKLLSQ
jgi:predicted nucleic acid-binding protein